MDGRTRRYLEEKSRIFKALGHPTRLFIVEELAKGERYIRDPLEMFGPDVSTVSRYLSILRNARITGDDKRCVRRLSSPTIIRLVTFSPFSLDNFLSIWQNGQIIDCILSKNFKKRVKNPRLSAVSGGAD
jgi:DNA-binding transcriptional ArsR family regulator